MKNYLKDIGFAAFLLVLAVLLLLSLFWALSIGTVKLPAGDIYDAVLHQFTSGLPIEATGQGPVHDIVWLLRLPRLVLAALVGAGLASCGVIMQAIVKNPLADPYILGISSGASLGATSAILLGVGAALGPNFVGIAAFIGAFVISLAVLFISNLGGRSNSMKLLLAGMALSAVCGAFSSFIVYFANNKEGMQTIAYWMMGSLAGAQWGELAVIAPRVPAVVSSDFFSYRRFCGVLGWDDRLCRSDRSACHPHVHGTGSQEAASCRSACGSDLPCRGGWPLPRDHPAYGASDRYSDFHDRRAKLHLSDD